MAKRGRPSKKVGLDGLPITASSKKAMLEVKLTKMDDVKFDASLFNPIKTGTIVDTILSNEGGIFPGTNTIIVGDPGVGKSTVLLDWMVTMLS